MTSTAPMALPVPSRLRTVALATVLVWGANLAQAQSLVDLYEAAKGFDATFQSARSAYDAATAKADQARAGLLPTVGLSAGASRSNVDNAAPLPDR
ncbi:MAG TPA: channel protein TolC, partial [Burkholderiaceae bacterium]|nr:channel protein TolC [Burkholderiaceae bacterium]